MAEAKINEVAIAEKRPADSLLYKQANESNKRINKVGVFLGYSRNATMRNEKNQTAIFTVAVRKKIPSGRQADTGFMFH
jgi:hypothetical protein